MPFGFRGMGRGRGFRFWYYATGMPGWLRAMYGLPAFGSGCWWLLSNPYFQNIIRNPQFPLQAPSPFQVTRNQQNITQNVEVLKQQKAVLENELKNLKEEIKKIEEKLRKMGGEK